MHIPVLLNETIESLAVKQGGVYIDGTLGGAGHSTRLMEKAGDGARLLGIDKDVQAVERCKLVLSNVPGAKTIVHGSHGDIASISKSNGFEKVDGILLDLGVSSFQIDEADRGFSFMKDGPLDMRMDGSAALSAADIVNTAPEEELERIFREYGEEKFAKRIARAICLRRATSKVETTSQLAELVQESVPRTGAKHPATRVFQALRMAVNSEIDDLKRALEGGLGLLKTGGRFAVITFESVTDRIVKRFFAMHQRREVSLLQGGVRTEGERPYVKLVFRHAVKPSNEEISNNVRSRSAKLRVAERTGE